MEIAVSENREAKIRNAGGVGVVRDKRVNGKGSFTGAGFNTTNVIL